MSKRKKILIFENDDFLREILGNLLHKKGFYIINGSSIEQGTENVKSTEIYGIIVGSSCTDYRGKATVHFLRTLFDNPRIFLINDTNIHQSYLPKQDQITTKDLSVATIISRISE